MKPFPAKYFNLIFFAMVAALMSGAVSFMVTVVNLYSALGFGRALIIEWLIAWAFAFPIAFPVAMIVAPLCRKLAHKITGQPEADLRGD